MQKKLSLLAHDYTVSGNAISKLHRVAYYRSLRFLCVVVTRPASHRITLEMLLLGYNSVRSRPCGKRWTIHCSRAPHGNFPDYVWHRMAQKFIYLGQAFQAKKNLRKIPL